MSDFRSGFACFVGRPNAGKSTLTNAIVGEKIAITSSKPQTTRRVIRGVLTREDLAAKLTDAGLVVQAGGAWESFAHRVDSSIRRDLIVAVNP